MFGDKKIVLQPLKIHDFESKVGEDQVLILFKFTLAIQESGVILSLVEWTSVTQLEPTPHSTEIQAILDAFADITLDELSQTLPPKHDIHAIDLLPSATLPNMLGNLG